MAVTMSNKSIPTGEKLTFNNIFAMFQENDKIIKEASRKMDMLKEQMGGLYRSFEEMAEHLAVQNSEERFNG